LLWVDALSVRARECHPECLNSRKNGSHVLQGGGSIPLLVGKRFNGLFKVADLLVGLCVDYHTLLCEIFLLAKGFSCPALKAHRRLVGWHLVGGLEVCKKTPRFIGGEIR
jgi:hypothetical protein